MIWPGLKIVTGGSAAGGGGIQGWTGVAPQVCLATGIQGWAATGGGAATAAVRNASRGSGGPASGAYCVGPAGTFSPGGAKTLLAGAAYAPAGCVGAPPRGKPYPGSWTAGGGTGGG